MTAFVTANNIPSGTAELTLDELKNWEGAAQPRAMIDSIQIRTPDGKDNTSAKQLPIVNRQMLALLKIMKIDTEGVINGDEDEL